MTEINNGIDRSEDIKVETVKPKSKILRNIVIVGLIIIFLNPFSLYFFYYFIGGFIVPSIQEYVFTVRCNRIDKATMIQQLKQDNWHERDLVPCLISKGWFNDREIALELVKLHGNLFGSLGYKLRGDQDIFLEANKNYPSALGNASPELQGDRKIVLIAIKQNWQAFKYVSIELKNDREVFFEANKVYPWALEYASPEIQDDKEIVLKMVDRDWGNIRYASARLQSDPDIIAIARKSPYYKK